jgi:hypothetical protein
MAHNDPNHRTPPRAEPLQPDRPGRGEDRQETGADSAAGERSEDGLSRRADKLEDQEKAAVENTREGYGGG